MTDHVELQAIYENRYKAELTGRNQVWAELCQHFWQDFIKPDAIVLDLACGYGHFINNITCGKKWAMDLNPSTAIHLNPDVTLLKEDCSLRWGLPDDCLDIIFASNCFEHLQSKNALSETIKEAARCLKPGGRLIAIGPNIKLLNGSYWDFIDHNIPLTEVSLAECVQAWGLLPEKVIKKFLPYTMVGGVKTPVWILRYYLRRPLLWRFFGKQFLVIAVKKIGS